MEGRTGRAVRRVFVVCVFAVLSLLASATPASAVTIGQTAPPDNFCQDDIDRAQPTVTSGNAYVVPSTVPNWTLTSWSTHANSSSGASLTMKVYRPLGGTSYQVVGHEGPHILSAGVLNTFPANVAVKAGDVLGNSVPFSSVLVTVPGCRFTVSGESHFSHSPNLADGQSGTFSPASDLRLNISAVVTPVNTFSLGALTRNKKKGTATLSFNLPNPGDLSGSGQGAQIASTGAVTGKAVPAGTATLPVKATGKKKRKLNEKGKVKLNLAVTYTPTGGDPSTQSVKVKLKKKLKKK